MLDKLDKIWIGLLFGLFFPMLCFVSYWFFFYRQINFPNGFIRYLMTGQMLQEVAILCVVANLVVFYLILNQKAYELSRGIMYATFAYVGLVLFISLL
jgi:hypothetical protein